MPTQAEEAALYRMWKNKGEGSFSPSIGPSLKIYEQVCNKGWATALGDNRFRITDAGKTAIKRR